MKWLLIVLAICISSLASSQGLYMHKSIKTFTGAVDTQYTVVSLGNYSQAYELLFRSTDTCTVAFDDSANSSMLYMPATSWITFNTFGKVFYVKLFGDSTSLSKYWLIRQ